MKATLNIFTEQEYNRCRGFSVRFDGTNTSIHRGDEVSIRQGKKTLVYFRILDITSGIVTLRVAVLLDKNISPSVFSLPENILKDFIVKMCSKESKEKPYEPIMSEHTLS